LSPRASHISDLEVPLELLCKTWSAGLHVLGHTLCSAEQFSILITLQKSTEQNTAIRYADYVNYSVYIIPRE